MPTDPETPETTPQEVAESNPLDNAFGEYSSDALDQLLGQGTFKGQPVRAEDPIEEDAWDGEEGGEPQATLPEEEEPVPAAPAPAAPAAPAAPSANELALQAQVRALQAQMGALLAVTPREAAPVAPPVKVEIPALTGEQMEEALSSPEAFQALLQSVADRAVEAARTERQQAIPEAVRAARAEELSTVGASQAWKAENADVFKSVAEGGLGLEKPFIRVVAAAEDAGKLSSDPTELRAQLTAIRAFVVQQAEEYRGGLAAPTLAKGKEAPPVRGRALPTPTGGGGSRRTAGGSPNGEAPNPIDQLLGKRCLV